MSNIFYIGMPVKDAGPIDHGQSYYIKSIDPTMGRAYCTYNRSRTKIYGFWRSFETIRPLPDMPDNGAHILVKSVDDPSLGEWNTQYQLSPLLGKAFKIAGMGPNSNIYLATRLVDSYISLGRTQYHIIPDLKTGQVVRTPQGTLARVVRPLTRLKVKLTDGIIYNPCYLTDASDQVKWIVELNGRKTPIPMSLDEAMLIKAEAPGAIVIPVGDVA